MEINIGNDRPPASEKPRRGRPPGSANKPRAAAGATDAATLKQALATMESLYQFTGMGLLMVNLPDTAEAWAAQTEALKESNEAALRSAPKLASLIANGGSVGGGTAFVVAHAMALAQITAVARMELARRRADAEPVTIEDSGSVIL